MKRLYILVLCLMIAGLACSVDLTSSSDEDVEGAVETAVAETEAARPTDTEAPPPTDTPVPPPTNTAVPVTTEPPPPTKAAEPLFPTETEVNLEGVATIEFQNNLNVPVTIKLKGPETRTFTVQSASKMVVEVEAGLYDVTLTAHGFNPSTGQRLFEPGKTEYPIGHT